MRTMMSVVLLALTLTACRWLQPVAFPEPQISGDVPSVDLSSVGEIVYFAPAANDNPFVAGERFAADGVTVVTTWADFTDATAQGVDAVMVHHDHIEQIDPLAIAHLYNRSVVVAGFDFSGAEMAALVGNPCIESAGFADDVTERNFIIVAHAINTDSADLIERISQNQLTTCTEYQAEFRFGSYSARSISEMIATQPGYDLFKFQLAAMIEDYQSNNTLASP